MWNFNLIKWHKWIHHVDSCAAIITQRPVVLGRLYSSHKRSRVCRLYVMVFVKRAPMMTTVETEREIKSIVPDRLSVFNCLWCQLTAPVPVINCLALYSSGAEGKSIKSLLPFSACKQSTVDLSRSFPNPHHYNYPNRFNQSNIRYCSQVTDSCIFSPVCSHS